MSGLFVSALGFLPYVFLHGSRSGNPFVPGNGVAPGGSHPPRGEGEEGDETGDEATDDDPGVCTGARGVPRSIHHEYRGWEDDHPRQQPKRDEGTGMYRYDDTDGGGGDQEG
ncbi:MAG: hypothetical protein RLZZ616_2503 [Pseudomonadota bacterium]